MKKAPTREQRPESCCGGWNSSKTLLHFHSEEDLLIIQKRLAAKWRDRGFFSTRRQALSILLGGEL